LAPGISTAEQIRCHGNAVVNGAEAFLQLAVFNLLDNAVRFAATKVRVPGRAGVGWPSSTIVAARGAHGSAANHPGGGAQVRLTLSAV